MTSSFKDRFLHAFDALAVKTARVDEPTAAPPLPEPPPAAPSALVPSTPATVSAPPPTPTLPPTAAPAPDAEADVAQLEDVVRLLRECVAQGERENDGLRSQVRSLERDVAFWKQESYATLAANPADITHSAPYVTLQTQCAALQTRVRALEADAALHAQHSAEQEQARRAAAAEQQHAAERHESELRDALARSTAEAEAQERAAQLAARDAIAALAHARAEAEAARVALEAEWTHRLREAQAAHEEREGQLARRVAELEVEVRREAELLALHRSGAEVDERPQSVVGRDELRCLQRDREMLAEQVRDLQRQLSTRRSLQSSKGKEEASVEDEPRPGPCVTDPQPDVEPPATGEADVILQRRFKLPVTQRQMALHGCAESGANGFAYLTQQYLCFGSSAVSSFFAHKDVVVPLTDVVSVDKTGKTTLVVARHDSSTITLKGLRERRQLAVQMRDAVLRLTGKEITMVLGKRPGPLFFFPLKLPSQLCQGQPDPDTGILREDDFELVF